MYIYICHHNCPDCSVFEELIILCIYIFVIYMYVYIYMLPPPMYLPFLPNLTQKHLYNYIIITKTLACRNTRLQCRHQAICRSTWCIQHHHHTGTSAAHATWHLGVCQGKYAPGASNIVRPHPGSGSAPASPPMQ